MVRHENRGEDIKKKRKKNVVGAKPKVSKPHSLSRDKKAVMIQMSSRKPPFSRQTLSHEQPK